MNKLMGALVAAVIVLSVVSGFLSYQLAVIQSQNSELRSRNTELETRNTELENLVDQLSTRVGIIDFSISGLKPDEKFIIWESDVYVKIKNLGDTDVEGLTLVIVGFGDERLAENLTVDALHVGEEKEISTHAYWAYGSYGTSTVTLLMNDSVLDEYTLEFSEVYPAKP